MEFGDRRSAILEKRSDYERILSYLGTLAGGERSEVGGLLGDVVTSTTFPIRDGGDPASEENGGGRGPGHSAAKEKKRRLTRKSRSPSFRRCGGSSWVVVGEAE